MTWKKELCSDVKCKDAQQICWVWNIRIHGQICWANQEFQYSVIFPNLFPCLLPAIEPKSNLFEFSLCEWEELLTHFHLCCWIDFRLRKWGEGFSWNEELWCSLKKIRVSQKVEFHLILAIGMVYKTIILPEQLYCISVQMMPCKLYLQGSTMKLIKEDLLVLVLKQQSTLQYRQNSVVEPAQIEIINIKLLCKNSELLNANHKI